MSLPDKHDKRLFRHYAQIAEDGSVLAVTECVHTKTPTPTTDAIRIIEVTALYPVDLDGLRESDLLEMLRQARG